MSIGIVVPCFNEELRLNLDYWHQLITEIHQVDWIFVNDGSEDNTLNVLRENLKFKNVQVLNLERNQGKSEAVRYGMLEFSKRLKSYFAIGFLDSDSAFSTCDVKRLVELCEKKIFQETHGFEAVISSRVKLAGRTISRNTNRHYISRILLTLVNWKWSEAPYDTQSGFKIFRNSTMLTSALEIPFRTKWFVDLELFARMGAMSGPNRIWEEPVQSWLEVPGSKIGAKTSFKITKDIYSIMKIASSARRSR